MKTAGAVEAILDPLLTSRGFAAGQDGGNAGEKSAQIIWCAAYDEFQARYPWLPQATGQDEFRSYACVDLTVTLNLGKIVSVDLEGWSVEETFRMIGRPLEAQQASSVIGVSADAGAQQLGRVLESLFSR